MHGLQWISMFCEEWGASALIFTSDEVKSEKHCGIASWVRTIVIHDNECTNLFLTRYFMSWTHNSAKKTIIDRSFRHCGYGLYFLTQHCDVTRVDMWRHANVGFWHCDAIFVDYSCTPKLAQRRSSLVNNNREYRFVFSACYQKLCHQLTYC